MIQKILFATTVLCLVVVSSLVEAAINSKVWVLDTASGTTYPNTTNIPLFANASFSIGPSIKNPTNNSLRFCYATGYELQLEIPSISSPAGSILIPFSEPTHLFFQNMFMGMEYQKGNTSYVIGTEYSIDNNYSITSLKVFLRRATASSQSVGYALETMHFRLVSDSQMMFSWSRQYLWFPQAPTSKTSFSSSWLFTIASQENPFQCVFSSSSRRRRRDRRHHHAPREHYLLKFRREQQKRDQEERAKIPHPKYENYIRRKHEAESSPISPLSVKSNKTLQNYVVFINNTWNISNRDLNVNGFLLALQGLVNRQGPVLYFIYPPSWEWTDSLSIFDYYNTTGGGGVGLEGFITLRNLDDVLDVFYNAASTYTAWWEPSREALIGGFTAAGIQSNFLIENFDFDLQNKINDRRQAHGLPGIYKTGIELVPPNFWPGMSKVEASTWLHDQVWNQTSREYIVWLGGVEGEIIQPGVADFIVNQKAFATDICDSPVHCPADHALGLKMLSQMNPGYLRMGWHSYAAGSSEHAQTTLTSQTRGTVEGLNTQPNFSFNHKVPLPADYVFRPNRMQAPVTVDANTVYFNPVQTDGLGLGAWVGHTGVMVYNWEAPLCEVSLQPAVLRYFYESATANDYFVGCLGGNGYMYPKAVPSDYLPIALETAQKSLLELGLQTQIIFDASECHQEYTTTGDTSLNQTLVDAYCKHMPFAQGFLNGYTNAYSFSVCPKNQQNHHKLLKNLSIAKKSDLRLRQGPGAFLSFDYYLDMSRPDESIVQDLLQLMAANPVGPYYLNAHIREYNSEARVAGLIQQVQSILKLNVVEKNRGYNKLVVVSSDVLTELAGKFPTFRQHFS